MARRKGRLALIAQWVIAAIVVGFAARELAHQWQGVAPALEGLRLDWPRVLASGALVIATYLLLIEAWRATLRVWSESLPFSAAARIWFVSNLGKYVPGKVWQIAAMGALAQKRGVSATAAIGSSLLVNLVSVLAGFAVIAATAAGRVGAVVGAQMTGGAERSAQFIVIAIAIAGAVALALAPVAVPWLAALAGRMTGRPLAIPRVPPKADGLQPPPPLRAGWPTASRSFFSRTASRPARLAMPSRTSQFTQVPTWPDTSRCSRQEALAFAKRRS